MKKPQYILNLDITYEDVSLFLEEKRDDILLGYTTNATQLAMINKLDLDSRKVKIYNCEYEYNYPANVIILSEELAKNIKHILTFYNYTKHVVILSRISIKFKLIKNMKYVGREDEFHRYTYVANNISHRNDKIDIPYDFSIYPRFILTKLNFFNKSYNIIREDLNPGGWYYRTIGELYQKFVKYETLGIIYNGVFKYLIAEIFCALQMKKKIYVFSIVKSHSVEKFIRRFSGHDVHYVFIHANSNESNNVIYSKHTALPMIRKYIKDAGTGLPNIKLLYGVFALEKYNILAKNVLHSIPLSMLHHGVRLWILYEPNNYINLIFTEAYKKFGYNIEILPVVISLSKFPGKPDEKICTKNGIYYIRDSIYKKTSDQEELPLINMSRYTESKYWPLIKEYGQEGDYILNYHGDVPHQIKLFNLNNLL